MDLAGRNHAGDAAVQAALDEAQHVLPRRKIADDNMDMGINQSWRQGAAIGVDDLVHIRRCQSCPCTYSGDPAIPNQHRFFLKKWIMDVARSDLSDILDQ